MPSFTPCFQNVYYETIKKWRERTDDDFTVSGMIADDQVLIENSENNLQKRLIYCMK